MRRQASAVLEHVAGGARVAVPRSDVFAAPARARMFSVRTSSIGDGRFRPSWFFVGTHGGAGTSLLARLTWEQTQDTAGQDAASQDAASQDVNGTSVGLPLASFGLDSGRVLPDPRLEPTGAVVAVARTSMAGLTRARELAAQYLAGAVPDGLRILGLITMADQPGRLPRELAVARQMLTGVYAHTWAVPYIPAYRLFSGHPTDPSPPAHPALVDAFSDIRWLITPVIPSCNSSEGQL